MAAQPLYRLWQVCMAVAFAAALIGLAQGFPILIDDLADDTNEWRGLRALLALVIIGAGGFSALLIGLAGWWAERHRVQGVLAGFVVPTIAVIATWLQAITMATLAIIVLCWSVLSAAAVIEHRRTRAARA